MATLINTDNIGNCFFNYRTPLILGEVTGDPGTYDFDPYFTAKWGNDTTKWLGSGSLPFRYHYIRWPASGLENRTGTITTTTNARFTFTFGDSYHDFWSGNVNGNNSRIALTIASNGASSASDVTFCVLNDYALCYATFTSTALTTLRRFVYVGWLREAQYTGNPYPRGLVALNTNRNYYSRPTAENTTSGTTTLSSAANSTTSPDITCSIATPGADCTDIVIRDSTAPNNAIGKLYNCISLPSACVVGGIYKNLGVDPEGSTQDKFLCVMNWGTRKLGMRIWTEGFV